MAGKKTLVNIFYDDLSLEYRDHPLSRRSVEWQPHDTHLLRLGNPQMTDHPYQSPQLPLWEPGEVEWFVIIRADPRVAPAPGKRADAVDPVAFVGDR